MVDYNSLSKEELIAIINGQNKEIEELRSDKRDLSFRIEELIARYESKTEELRSAVIERFIPKSEKIETGTINELEDRICKRRKTPTENFLSELKKAYTGETIILDYDFESNGVDRASVKQFGYDETYKLICHHPEYELIKYVKPKYRDNEHIYMNNFVEDPFPHSPLTPSLAANILTMKYILGVPFFRYANYMCSNGIEVSDVDIAHWAKNAALVLEPLYNVLLRMVTHPEVNVLHIDETPLKVLDSEKSKSYMFIYATSVYEHPIHLYDFVDGRSTSRTKEILSDYKGYVIVDGYSGYDSLKDSGIKIQRCMVHSRRYFFDCFKTLNGDDKKKHKAYKAVELMNKIFEAERKFKDKKYTPSKIKEERNKPYYLKHIEKLDKYINSLKCDDDTLLTKAVNYYLNAHDELYTFLEDGHVDVSNNLAERVVKPFVISRKNFLFCKSVNGAETTAKLFTIAETARANGLKVEEYLNYILENITTADVYDLLPWSNKLPGNIKISKNDIE